MKKIEKHDRENSKKKGVNQDWEHKWIRLGSMTRNMTIIISRIRTSNIRSKRLRSRTRNTTKEEYQEAGQGTQQEDDGGLGAPGLARRPAGPTLRASQPETLVPSVYNFLLHDRDSQMLYNNRHNKLQRLRYICAKHDCLSPICTTESPEWDKYYQLFVIVRNFPLI